MSSIDIVKELLLSNDFKNKKLSLRSVIKNTKKSEETVRYWYYKFYHPDRWGKRYGYKKERYEKKKLSTV